ncbi:transferrin-binding protein-like solute binding protein [Sphingomonas sp. MMS12-HWE2-04]|uniref:transferrin-binding protein-like solute binding protein n=1 Tax=Sphingomonas sp. MMS12-HWE2-04 TaxID=3234199 RepID=UPI00384DB868
MRAIGIMGATAVLSLAACGGGGGGSTAPSTPIAATPTPSPPASATPTPTPVDPASYDIAFDLTRDREFALFGAEISSVFNGSTYESVDVKLLDLGALAYARYVAATQATTISIFNVASDTYTSPAAQSSNAISYGTPERSLALFKPGPSMGGLRAELTYTIGATQHVNTALGAGETRIMDRRFVSGTATVATDIPASGSAAYATIASEYGLTAGSRDSYTALAQSGGFNVDFASRSVTASIVSAQSQIIGAPVSTITLNFSGDFVGQTSQIAGTLTTSDGGSGRWAGRVYGPSGRELAVAFTYVRGAKKVIGTAEATLNR